MAIYKQSANGRLMTGVGYVWHATWRVRSASGGYTVAW